MHHANAILLSLFIVFVAAQIGAEVAQRLKLPGVVGEIAAGCVIGPSVMGWITPEQVAVGTPLDVLSEIGVVLLLFSVGLETRLEDLKKVGKSAFLVGVLGVLLPFAMGGFWLTPVVSSGASRSLLPLRSWRRQRASPHACCRNWACCSAWKAR